MVDEPLRRISRVDLDKVMVTMDVASARLSECLFAEKTSARFERSSLPTIHYGLTGSGIITIEGEAAIELVPHMLLVAPAKRAINIVTAGSSSRGRGSSGGIAKEAFTPGSMPRYELGEGEKAFSFVCGSFRAVYGAGLDLFASLASPVVETFETDDQIDRLMRYAMVELAVREIGGGPMASALFKLVLLNLLRRSLTSANAWVERFALLNDPPIARAFAEMASHPAADYNVQSLCRSVGLSRSAFMARFAAAFDDSPMSVLRRLRMRHAASLLAANAGSIEQIALHAGYQSRSSFTRTFRKHYGTDPSDYRSEAKRVSDIYDVAEDATAAE
ncbi:helix-turn-helix domain-containing protein [Rhizobium leguminosarum]|uniref:helix-turn-helix transcriptional regulator n=1 Tax=Rhizobium ruizarguesonis TaxID=2081791 RepID=UPI0013DFF053|nr:AraC family transcriptional regulator [Rhizobium ruizarguesonis]NEJ88412.1 helix-turn-helix domain-containing protein [Rhizobium ruizarguesonis]